MDERPHLRSGSLSFLEVLATSIALIGPSMTPVLIAPYMYSVAGNGTWLAYAFGGTMLIFVALNLNAFTRRSASSGSMYSYAAETLGPAVGTLAGFSLLWAYGFVAAATLGAMALFVEQLLGDAGIHIAGPLPAIAIDFAFAVLCWQAAYRGVAVSAIVMLVLEAVSVAIIAAIIGIVLIHHGATIDPAQLHLQGVSPAAIGLGIATAVFSLVGFESATAFGEEAKRPLVTIPRAVLWSVAIASAFFIVATYAEIVGLRNAATPLDKEQSPLGALATIVGAGYLRVPITIGALLSAFSVCLACVTTWGRIALAMARAGILPAGLTKIEPRHDTPHIAVTTAVAVSFLVAVIALARGVAPIDLFDDGGTLSSFGFIVIYALIAIAAPVYIKRTGPLGVVEVAVSVLALVFLLVPAVTLFYPAPPPPANVFPYAFLGFLLASGAWVLIRRRRTVTSS